MKKLACLLPYEYMLDGPLCSRYRDATLFETARLKRKLSRSVYQCFGLHGSRFWILKVLKERKSKFPKTFKNGQNCPNSVFGTSKKIFEHSTFIFVFRFCCTSMTSAALPRTTWSVLPPFAAPEIAPGSAARCVSQLSPKWGQSTTRQYGIPPPSGGKAPNSAAPCNVMQTTTGHTCYMAIARNIPVASASL